MNAMFEWIGWNTLAATVLALAVLVIGRFWKRPELLHVLWLVVLVKLVTPGMIRWAALPAPTNAGVTTQLAPVVEVPTGASAVPVVEHVAVEPWWLSAPLALWIAGSLVFLLLACIRLRSFQRALRASLPPTVGLLDRIRALAERLEVAVPRTRVVDAAVPPMVWCGPSGALLVLPAGLIETLDPEGRDAILAHELAHLKRRDPWIRWVELAVTIVLWWNPIVWWVRRNLRRAEEQACDRRVLEVLPESRRAYADSIVKTVEYLAGHGRTPVLATGAIGTRHIEERLIMILRPSNTRRLRRPFIPALLVAILALPIVPGFADRKEPSREDSQAREQLIALEREALELERRLQELHMRRAEVEREMERTRAERESVEMERQVQELRRQGMREEAGQLEDEIERMRSRSSDQKARQHEMLDRERAMRHAELEFRESLIELERARQQEDAEAVEDYESAVEMYERALAQRAQEQAEAHELYARAQQQHEKQALMEDFNALERQRQRLIEDGRYEEAEELTSELRDLKHGLKAQKLHEKAREKAYEKDHKQEHKQLVVAQADLILQLSKIEMAMRRTEDPGTLEELEVQYLILSEKLAQIEANLEFEGAR